jgi:hypothetical protein
MPQYQEQFPVGSKVRVASLPSLEAFRSTWRFHNKLSSDQLAYADRVTEVIRVGFYHGGDVLYELKDAPGIWHEGCLLGAGGRD